VIARADYRFATIPGPAITDPALDHISLRVLCLLARHTDRQRWCFRSQVTMAAELRVGRATVQRAIAQLEAAGYLEAKARGRKGQRAPEECSHPYAAHAYRVVFDTPDDTPETEEAAASMSSTGVPTDGHGVPVQEGRGCPDTRAPNRTPHREPHLGEQLPPVPPSPRRTVEEILGKGLRENGKGYAPGTVTIISSEERIARFQQKLAPQLGDHNVAWMTLHASMYKDHPDHAAALAACKRAARELGKGWPREYPCHLTGGAPPQGTRVHPEG